MGHPPMSAPEPLDGPDGRTPDADKSGVKGAFTPHHRSKRPKRDVETMEYLGAARRFIRAAGRRVGECDEHEQRELLSLQTDLDAAFADAVAGQRAYGKSWTAIGIGAGTSREAAYQRWGKK